MRAISREGAVAEYQVAVENRQFRWANFERATADYRAAKAEADQRRYEAIISVVCPACHAEVDDSCFLGKMGPEPGYTDQRVFAGPHTQHGVRQDLSGVNGEPHRERQLKAMSS